MNRRTFIKTSSLAGANLSLLSVGNELTANRGNSEVVKRKPLAITMWDFSWLERRWPGGSYGNWDKILKELTERGYNAVRIDAYPHLIANGKHKTWRLKPVWDQHDWGSPALIDVQVQPNLNKFIEACGKHGVKVGLSSWYREDIEDIRMQITSAKIMAQQWIDTLESIEQAGLMEHILYVDLCNEWPGAFWAPYFTNEPPDQTWGNWHSDVSMAWMKTATNLVKEAYPDIPASFSFDFRADEQLKKQDLSFIDFGEPHIWMCQYNGSEFYQKIEYGYDLFKPDSYQKLALNGKRVYEENKAYWQAALRSSIAAAAEASVHLNKPLITTECWGVIDYKDWPMLEWDWIKELCTIGVAEAAKTGQWLAIATSNFCGPQFRGMWDDITWHKEQTELITNAVINKKFNDGKLLNRL